MSENKRTIEVYLGYQDGTWDTDYVEIIDNNMFPIEDLVDIYMQRHMKDYKNIVFWGIYNIPEDDNDEV